MVCTAIKFCKRLHHSYRVNVNVNVIVQTWMWTWSRRHAHIPSKFTIRQYSMVMWCWSFGVVTVYVV